MINEWSLVIISDHPRQTDGSKDRLVLVIDFNLYPLRQINRKMHDYIMVSCHHLQLFTTIINDVLMPSLMRYRTIKCYPTYKSQYFECFHLRKKRNERFQISTKLKWWQSSTLKMFFKAQVGRFKLMTSKLHFISAGYKNFNFMGFLGRKKLFFKLKLFQVDATLKRSLLTIYIE